MSVCIVLTRLKVGIDMTTFYSSTQSEPHGQAFLSFLEVVFRNSSPGLLKDTPTPAVTHRFIKPVATDCFVQFLYLLHASAFFLCFPSLKKACLQPRLHGNYFWQGFSEQWIDQLKAQMYVSDPMSVFILFYRPNTSFAFHFSRFHSLFKNTLAHHPETFSVKELYGNHLIMPKYYFMPVQLCYLWYFL